MLLRDFLRWLRDRDPSLNQSVIGRRAGLSQAVIGKIMTGTSIRPALETYQKILGTFSAEWRAFLGQHPGRVATEIRQLFPWIPPSLDAGDDPLWADAVSALQAFFDAAPPEQRAQLIYELRAKADYFHGLSTPPKAAGAEPGAARGQPRGKLTQGHRGGRG